MFINRIRFNPFTSKRDIANPISEKVDQLIHKPIPDKPDQDNKSTLDDQLNILAKINRLRIKAGINNIPETPAPVANNPDLAPAQIFIAPSVPAKPVVDPAIIEQRNSIQFKLQELTAQKEKLISGDLLSTEGIMDVRQQIETIRATEKALVEDLIKTYPENSAAVEALQHHNNISDLELRKQAVMLELHRLDCDRDQLFNAQTSLDPASAEAQQINQRLDALRAMRQALVNADKNFTQQLQAEAEKFNSSIINCSTPDKHLILGIRKYDELILPQLDKSISSQLAEKRNSLSTQLDKIHSTLIKDIIKSDHPDKTDISRLEAIDVLKKQIFMQLDTTYELDSPQQKVTFAMTRLCDIHSKEKSIIFEVNKLQNSINQLENSLADDQTSDLDYNSISMQIESITSLKDSLMVQYQNSKSEQEQLLKTTKENLKSSPVKDRRFLNNIIRTVIKDEKILQQKLNNELIVF